VLRCLLEGLQWLFDPAEPLKSLPLRRQGWRASRASRKRAPGWVGTPSVSSMMR
jgi:hypothetical protein